MQEDSNQHIEPEAFAPASKNSTSSNKNQGRSSGEISHAAHRTEKTIRKSVLTWAIPALLLVLALLVVILPAVKDKQSEQTEPETISNTQLEQVINASTPEETPWADAQLLKARRDTQEILSELLSVQKRLESMQVDKWALAEFNIIKLAAEEGDSLYKERQFEQSLGKYSKALDSALTLDASIPEVALDYQEKGKLLLEQNRTEEALATLQTSILLMPDTEATQDLLQQAKVRENVLLLIDQSNSLARNERSLEDAKALLVEAQTLDTSYSPLTDLIENIDQKILERDFRKHMSKGFSALGSGYYQQATDAFNQAARLKPNNSATTEALQQVEAARLNTKRQASLNRAIELEASEQWEAALTTYSSLLNEDASLTAAQLGKLRTQARFNLDSAIETIINKPLSLQSEKNWQSASKTLADARGIINSGKRLTSQIDILQKLLVTARTPVILKINSDGLTDVEIYRVGKLGTFSEQAMNLNPGKYVIVGRRSGYQDVRVELSIDGSKPEITVPIVCSVNI